MGFSYAVHLEIEARLADALAAWLAAGHVDEVCALGGASAEVVRLDPSAPDEDVRAFEVRYRFASRRAFAAYEREHAPRLRAEALARFGTALRVRRRTGEIIHVAGGAAS